MVYTSKTNERTGIDRNDPNRQITSETTGVLRHSFRRSGGLSWTAIVRLADFDEFHTDVFRSVVQCTRASIDTLADDEDETDGGA